MFLWLGLGWKGFEWMDVSFISSFYSEDYYVSDRWCCHFGLLLPPYYLTCERLKQQRHMLAPDHFNHSPSSPLPLQQDSHSFPLPSRRRRRTPRQIERRKIHHAQDHRRTRLQPAATLVIALRLLHRILPIHRQHRFHHLIPASTPHRDVAAAVRRVQSAGRHVRCASRDGVL